MELIIEIKFTFEGEDARFPENFGDLCFLPFEITLWSSSHFANYLETYRRTVQPLHTKCGQNSKNEPEGIARGIAPD